MALSLKGVIGNNKGAIQVVDVLAIQYPAAPVVSGRYALPLSVFVGLAEPTIAHKAVIERQTARRLPSEDDCSL